MRSYVSLGALCLLVGALSAPARAAHNPGEDCFSCHAYHKAAGTVFATPGGLVPVADIAFELIAENGSRLSQAPSDADGNMLATTLDEGGYLITVGERTSRSWHEFPAQRSCNGCHVPGGNADATRTTSLPEQHTVLPPENSCRDCHHFPQNHWPEQLATTGVLNAAATPLPLPSSSVEIWGQSYAFDPTYDAVSRRRPDVFAPGHFSMFDAILAVAQRERIDIVYHYDEDRACHFIDTINGYAGNSWYYWSYDAGDNTASELLNRRCNRWDEALWRPGVHIRVGGAQDLAAIKAAYASEITRERALGHVIPEVTIRINPTDYEGNPPGSDRITVTREFSNVQVTPHDLRSTGTASHCSKPFQPGVITSLDVLLSLADQGELTAVTQAFYSRIGEFYIDSYYVQSIGVPGVGVAHASGNQGFTYLSENGSPRNLPNDADPKMHMTSDIHVIHAPDFAEWKWTELGNPYYGDTHPTGVDNSSVAEDFGAIGRGFNLHDPYPNPFNGRLQISFNIFEPGPVRIAVHDVRGRRVAVLEDGFVSRLGVHRLDWEAENLPSGSYHLTMRRGTDLQVRRVVYLK